MLKTKKFFIMCLLSITIAHDFLEFYEYVFIAMV